jgi:hypothetical protein
MNYDAIEADQQAMRVIELLIESGHYKGFHKDEVIKAIARDANSLSAAFTLKPEQTAEPAEAPEPPPDSMSEVVFPKGWTKPIGEGNA